MELYKEDYIKPPSDADVSEYAKIVIQETQDSLIGSVNLRYRYPSAIRHHNSLFPNNHIELLDFSVVENDEVILDKETIKLTESFNKLIHAQHTNERDILRFINHEPAWHIPTSIFIAGGFQFGHHESYLFPEFALGNEFRTDYLLIGKGSGGYEFIFVEFEKSQGRITLKSGHSGEAIRKGCFQIDDWKSWIDSHSSTFYKSLQTLSNHKAETPEELKKYDSTRFHYVVVAGLRDDYNETTYRERRRKAKENGVIMLHYDNLYDSAKELEKRNTF